MAPIQRQGDHLLQSVEGNTELLIFVDLIQPLHGLSDRVVFITL